ncbi:MAG: NAD(P)/FAD-dependent oxidoreductase [Solirubrobacteraceae bacterium]
MTDRVVIVGSGIAGLGVALGALRRGLEVTVLERGTPGSGSTYGNAGWVSTAQAGPVPAPGVLGYAARSLFDSGSALRLIPRGLPAAVSWLTTFAWHCRQAPYERGVHALHALGNRAVSMLDELGEAGVEGVGRDTRMLVVAIRAGELERFRNGLSPLVDAGMLAPGPMLDGDSVRALEPFLGRGVLGGFVIDEHHQVEPWVLARGLTAYLRKQGVVFMEGTSVSAVHADERSVTVRAGAHTVTGDALVLATGAEAPALARQLGVRLPVLGGRGYSVEVSGAAPLGGAVMVTGSHVAISPIGGGIRIAGTMELPATSTVVDEARVEALLASAREATTGWSHQSMPWCGLRPLAPDGLPIIDRIQARVYVATAYSMLGMTVGLPAGDALAALIAEGSRPPVLEPFCVDRAAVRRTWM